MDYETSEKKNQPMRISPVSIALILLGVIVLPLLALLPFKIHASNFLLVLAYSDVDGSQPIGCIGGVKGQDGYSAAAINQCASWQAPAVLTKVAILSFLVVSVISLALGLYAYTRKHQQAKLFTLVWSLSALATAAITVTAYSIMRTHSQGHGFVAANQLANGEYEIVHPAALGFGINPAVLVLLLVIYLAVPLMSWYGLSFRRNHPNKKALFQ